MNAIPYFRQQFKDLVRTLVKEKIYPSPSAIRTAQNRPTGAHSLNGRECDLREEVLKELGWRYIGSLDEKGRAVGTQPRYRWLPPKGTVVMALDSGKIIGEDR